MVQAIALNGIGFNLTRAVGPALAGLLMLLGGSSLAFSLYAVSILAVIAALLSWHRERRFTGLPREQFVCGDARRHALRAQHAGDPGGDGAHCVVFDPGLGAVGAAAAVRAARSGPRPRHVRR